jgi:acetyltransferase-like isoleucine patch superfamily enzyme
MKPQAKEGFLARQRKKDLHAWINLLDSFWPRLKSRLYYPFVFASFGRGSILYAPTFLGNAKYIHIGKRVHIRPGVRLEVVLANDLRLPQIVIEDDVNIEQNVHIVCHNRILVEAGASITGFCSIVDTTHPIDGLGTEEKMGSIILDDDAVVTIGRGAFLGMGARILPNVRIGAGAVIGANSVVTHDVPDYAVAAGVPAKVRRLRKIKP